MSNCVAHLIVGVPGLERNLLARKVSVKEESLNAESLIASKLWALLLRNGNCKCRLHAAILALQYKLELQKQHARILSSLVGTPLLD